MFSGRRLLNCNGKLKVHPPPISKGMTAPQFSYIPIRNPFFVFLAASADNLPRVLHEPKPISPEGFVLYVGIKKNISAF